MSDEGGGYGRMEYDREVYFASIWKDGLGFDRSFDRWREGGDMYVAIRCEWRRLIFLKRQLS